jgi:hypothetical protein
MADLQRCIDRIEQIGPEAIRRAEAAEARAEQAERERDELRDAFDFQTDALEPGSLSNELMVALNQRDRAAKALTTLIERVERDRREPDKLLLRDPERASCARLHTIPSRQRFNRV